jgi:1-acyl-sn-glycerol-3-phosphate acyltransferase
MSLESKPHDNFLKYFSRAVDFFARYYNGFEARQTEYIPQKGHGLIVFYHSNSALDAWYFGLQYYINTGRMIRGLADDWLFKTPGLKWMMKAIGAVPASPEAALELLNDGHLVGVAPGGVREAVMGSPGNYKLSWGNRIGFAKLALNAKCPIIPAFTENVNQMYKTPFAHHGFFQNVYEKTRLPIIPFVGLGILPFPVKLRSWVGEPILPRDGETPEELAQRTKLALEKLINKHQTVNQTVLGALKQRLK